MRHPIRIRVRVELGEVVYEAFAPLPHPSRHFGLGGVGGGYPTQAGAIAPVPLSVSLSVLDATSLPPPWLPPCVPLLGGGWHPLPLPPGGLSGGRGGPLPRPSSLPDPKRLASQAKTCHALGGVQDRLICKIEPASLLEARFKADGH
jgi:hypothetical protein